MVNLALIQIYVVQKIGVKMKKGIKSSIDTNQFMVKSFYEWWPIETVQKEMQIKKNASFAWVLYKTRIDTIDRVLGYLYNLIAMMAWLDREIDIVTYGQTKFRSCSSPEEVPVKEYSTYIYINLLKYHI